MNILSRFAKVKSFVFDMDGVLTDGGLLIQSESTWVRRMDIKDGYALNLAARSGYKIFVISGSESKPVSERLIQLGVSEVHMKVTDKEELLKSLVVRNGIRLDELLFMGDDIPDMGCLRIAGISGCPADAVPEVKEICSYISPFGGGHGCVRDVIEKVLKLNNR
jgi:3-deoxy-D-manno-octulosonate 8-phosphate phosphatase (KDO 8-P phosphatase)